MKILAKHWRLLNKPGSVCLVNEKGIPGELTSIVKLQNGAWGVLSNYHVLFGGGARKGATVWLRETYKGKENFFELANNHEGYIGSVEHVEGKQLFVDCAVAILKNIETLPFRIRKQLAKHKNFTQWGEVTQGATVSKWGATTGLTTGTVIDAQYPDSPHIAGKSWTALNQLLIAPQDINNSFSATGDSGAAIVDSQGKLVAMLWGTTNNGEGLACPIAPVFNQLGITLEKISSKKSVGTWLRLPFEILRSKYATR